MYTLLISESEVKDIVPISRNVTITSPLLQSILEAQDAWIRPIFGDDLYDNFFAAVEGSLQVIPIPLPANYVTLSTKLKPTLAWYTIYQALPYNWAHIREAGTVNQTGQAYSQLDLSALSFIRKELLQAAERNALSLSKFLKDNYVDYPLYTNCNICNNNNKGFNSYFMNI